MSDIYKAQFGQIWYIGDSENKYNMEEEDNRLRGKRPAFVLRSSGSNSTVIPLSTSVRYSQIDRNGIEIINGTKCYPAIDQARTLTSKELNDYVGILKPSLCTKIQKLFIDYILGKISYSSQKNAYIYITNSNNFGGYEVDYINDIPYVPMSLTATSINSTDFQRDDTTIIKTLNSRNYQRDNTTITTKPISEENSNVTNTDSDNNVSKETETDKKKYNKYTDEDKIFILTHLNDDIAEKYKLAINGAYSLKNRIAKQLDCKNPSLYKYEDRVYITTNSEEDIMKQFGINALSAKYLKAYFAEKMKK